MISDEIKTAASPIDGSQAKSLDTIRHLCQ
jgi:hypothetical protein